MFERYHAHIRGEPERKIWKLHAHLGFFAGTDEEIHELAKDRPLKCSETAPRDEFTAEEINEVTAKYTDAVVRVKRGSMKMAVLAWSIVIFVIASLLFG